MMAGGGLAGAREGGLVGIRRLVAQAMAHDLGAFVVPGPDIARAHGLDLAKAGLPHAATPRHANVLVLLGEIPPALTNAVAIAYAQMPRPRAVLALGSIKSASFPVADVSKKLSQEGLLEGVAAVRRAFATGAFQSQVDDFEAPALKTRIQYTCPMHPEVVHDEPGSCPECGMILVPKETEAADDPHAGHVMGGNKNDPSGQDGQEAHAGHGNHGAQDEQAGEGGHNAHAGHGMGEEIEGIEPQFMSMAEMTKGQPRSSDGLQMDWIKVPFGPFFPGLPGGLGLAFTLDGDTVADSEMQGLLGMSSLLVKAPMPPEEFAMVLERLMPQGAVSYGLLARMALEDAAGIQVSEALCLARAGALERERVASHLSWLGEFGVQSGLGWLTLRAGELQLKIQTADSGQISALTLVIAGLVNRLKKTPMLRMRLEGIGMLGAAANTTGPNAKASGSEGDLRSQSVIFTKLGFKPVTHSGADALARLLVRCDEIVQSLGFMQGMESSGQLLSLNPDVGSVSGDGQALIETPRGRAGLRVRLDKGEVISAELETPSQRHGAHIANLTHQQELGDALAAVQSLDLSPWEILENRAAEMDGGMHP